MKKSIFFKYYNYKLAITDNLTVKNNKTSRSF